MEWWVFQPQPDITVLELANLIGKLRKMAHSKKRDFNPNLLAVTDRVYDKMIQEYKRHFILYSSAGVYQEYCV